MLEQGSVEQVSLREHVEAILEEQRQATKVAEREREKAAQIARDGLEAQLLSGDLALERHIAEQVQQIRQLIQMGREAVEAAFAASDRAITKAEEATEKRFESVNEFRAQLAAQTVTFATREAMEGLANTMVALIERNREDIAEQRGAYVPVPGYDTTIKEWSTWRTSTDAMLATHQQRIIGRDGLDDLLAPMRERVDSVQSFQFKIVGALILVTVILPMITAFAVYLLTRQAVPISGL